MKKDILAKIKIIDINDILPFEKIIYSNDRDFDQSEIKIIKHPLLVTPIENESYLLLDNTELFNNYINSGLEHIPIQVNDDTEIEIRSFQIGFDNFDDSDLVKLSEKYPDQILMGELSENQLGKFIEIGFTFGDKSRKQIYLRNSTQAGCPYPIDIIIDSIVRNSSYSPVFERRNRQESLTRLRKFDAVMDFPKFSLRDLIRAAQSDRLFPNSIINIIPQCRIFNIDFPISVLKSDISLDEKQAFLKELITLRFQTRKALYYTGQVYFLNQ